MESKFIPTLQLGNGYTHLKLRGILDEDNVLTALLSQIQGRLLLVDLAEIERINSCGVRDWVNWLNQIQALGVQVILLRCSPSAISQANMVANFAADAFIHSFYAPYVHPDTGEEQSVLLFTEDLRQMKPITAPKIYNDRGEELEFDEFEESYFAFIHDPRMMQYTIAEDIQSVIQYFVPEAVSHQPVISPKLSTSILASAASNAMASRASMNAIQAGRGPNFGAAQSNFAPMPSQASASYAQASPQSNAYASSQQASPYHQSQNAAPVASQAQMTPTAAPHASPYGNPSSPVRAMPTPAQPMRHEQPPIPNASQYQSLSNSKLPAQNPAPAYTPAQNPVHAAPVPGANQMPPRQNAQFPNAVGQEQRPAYASPASNPNTAENFANNAPAFPVQRQIQTMQVPLKPIQKPQLSTSHKLILAIMASIAVILILMFIVLLVLR